MKISGSLLALFAVTIFAMQDAVTKHIAQDYSAFLITMVRYWAFALFSLYLVYRTKKQKGGFLKAIHSERPMLQLFRSVLLFGQILVSITSFAYVGLAQSMSIFSSAPLAVAVLSIPILGEKVGWRRWVAIVIGMMGMLIIINPLGESFSSLIFIPLICVGTTSLYAITTRLAGRGDSPEVSFFYTGMVGVVMGSCIGPFFWTPVSLEGWAWLAVLCATSVAGHYMLIRALALTEAVTVQTITYLQLVYATIIGFFIFNEDLTLHMLVGSVIVVAAGTFTIWREHRVNRANRIKADHNAASIAARTSI